MAKKKPAEKESVIAEADVDMKAIRLAVPADVHKKFRIIAINQDTNMSHLAQKLVEDFVEQHSRKESR